MKLAQLVADDAPLPPGCGDAEISALTLDSRGVGPGALFAGLQGARVDGAQYIPGAIEAGAACILTGRDARIPWSPIDGAAAPDGGPDGDARAPVPIIRSDDPRRVLARMAARFFGAQPETTVAVTGTSGKSSVADFTRQVFDHCGHQAAALGTIGLIRSSGVTYGGLTTPDPVSLQAQLANIAADGVTHLAFEASSHGLDQRRLDGVVLKAAAFTNLGRDHLDYHPTVEDYLKAKLRLFEVLLPRDGVAVLNADCDVADEVRGVIQARGQRLIEVGRAGAGVRLVDERRDGFDQILSLEVDGRRRDVRLPLPGAYQAENALVAAGLALAVGEATETVLDSLERLNGVPGRMEIVARVNGALAVVDYAHKPEALEAVLRALRPYATNRLICLFGCGGDRDAGKRPIMGEIAARLADVVIVTDDNPRTEDPAAIRAQIMAAASHAIEIADRAAAIDTAAADLRPGDVLVVAGKGHETGQIIGGEVLPFSDVDVVRIALGAPSLGD